MEHNNSKKTKKQNLPRRKYTKDTIHADQPFLIVDGFNITLNINPERSTDFQIFTKVISDLVHLKPTHSKNSHQNTLKVEVYTQKISDE